MPELSLNAIGELPEYKELIRKRRAIAIPLMVITLTSYYAFILLVAYAPDFLKITLFDGVTTIGIALGFGVIVVTLAVTAFYVWYANHHLEALVTRIQQKAAGHE
jgi:uncharacterized membrane protein (DUF485 family)